MSGTTSIQRLTLHTSTIIGYQRPKSKKHSADLVKTAQHRMALGWQWGRLHLGDT
jgi:hypothetical protein